ncbi:exopolysaccharide biosynthesis protein [filamentous cyanobacterium LEGE 11480]|uniref:Exopolysaccharide biosynthesis protein n=1 Tax=Romeriopsis navalis LEGE 11480 TaxID=2777977 RepID=A0A928VWM5_9CYAN|nr:exopolysaccharide biosynthesis protein [Romeriopsis navalis]MBE9033524.1 exopolysaccharide biosynthesis protein [Romeriopsis navalis LEGE 11480]
MASLSNELEKFFFQNDRWPEAVDSQSPEDSSPESHPPSVDPSPDKVTLANLLELAGERTFGFLFVLLALPSALPVPAPGYSIPFGIAMLLLAGQLIIGRDEPWFPQKWRHHGFEVATVQKLMKAGLPWLKRIEAISRPRMTSVCHSLPGRIVIGCTIALMSLSMMIPIPGTNTIPAMGIFVTGFGLLDDDGAISLGGLLLCGVGLAVSISILLAIAFGGSSLIDMAKAALGR